MMRSLTPAQRDRACGCLLGLAIGDALGATLEFRARDTLPVVRDLIGGGPFDLKPGEWTDDTSMALCLADSLIACGRSTGHHEVWEEWRQVSAVKLLSLSIPPVILEHEYEDFPRGRIVYERPTNRFVVYADRKLFTPYSMSQIVERFKIGALDWTYRPDLHYCSE